MDDTEIWELPSWAADTIQETMAKDATSKMFEPSLRAEIAKANDEMRTITTQYKQMAGTLNEVIALLYPEGYDGHEGRFSGTLGRSVLSTDHYSRNQETLEFIEAAIARYMAPTD